MSRSDLFCVGDASIDTYVRVPYIVGPDQKAIGELLGVFGGGMAANFAAGAVAVGATASFMTVTGDDNAGNDLIAELANHGVDTSPVQRLPGSHTFQCFIQLDDRGEKALVGAHSGHKVPEIDTIPRQLFTEARFVYALADDLNWALEVGAIAKANGAKFAVDLEQSATSQDETLALEVAANADVVFTNKGAFSHHPNTTVAEVLETILQTGVPTVVVTGGAEGTIAQDGTGRYRSNALTVPVIDSTGAGDAHNGALLGRLAAGDPLPVAMISATAMGALTVGTLGPRNYQAELASKLPPLQRLAAANISTTKTSPSRR